MNDIRRILALVGDSARSGLVLSLAARLARQQGATVAALHVAEPSLGQAYLSPEAASVAIEMADRLDGERRGAARATCAEVAAAHAIDLPFHSPGGDPLANVLAMARCADLVVMGQREPNGADGTGAGFAARVLVGAGCAVLFAPWADVLPIEADGAPRCGDRVLVGWSASRESARALRDALPLLRVAQRVDLLRFAAAQETGPEPLDAVVDYLRRHGVQAVATVRRPALSSIGERLISRSAPDTSVAESLLSHAADGAANLVVMGGFGHPRAWELVLGGVTRTMLQSMTVPVLMSH